jgi:hypothetical protein
MIPLNGETECTGSAWPFTSAIGGLDDTITRFAQASVNEIDDDSSTANFPNTAIE